MQFHSRTQYFKFIYSWGNAIKQVLVEAYGRYQVVPAPIKKLVSIGTFCEVAAAFKYEVIFHDNLEYHGRVFTI